MLEKDFEYYKSHQAQLVDQYRGRWIVIKDQSVIGDYDSELEALDASRQKYDMGTFFIQYVEPGSTSYTQTFHSRVAA